MMFNMIALIYLAALGAVHFPSTVTGCAITAAQIDAYYGTGDGYWRIRLAWSSDNPDCKVHLHEQVDGKDKFEIVESNECTKGKYCYFKTSKQCCSNGKMQYKSMKFSTECSCHVASFTFTIQSLLSGSSSPYCESIISPGATRRVKADNMEFKECGEPCPLVTIPRNCPAVGCYCKDGYTLNTTTGKCYKEQCLETPINCTKLTLVTPECVKWDKDKGIILISWKAEGEGISELPENWQYTYTISSSSTIIRTETVQSDTTEGFKVTGKYGELTIPGRALTPDNYTIEVVAITSTNNCSGNGSFSIKIGCLPSIPIILNVPECNRFNSEVTISWNAQNNRKYEYSITEFISSKEVLSGYLTGEGIVTIPGKFLEVGSYIITVEDLSTENKSINSTDFEIKAGCKDKKELNPDVNAYCNKTGVQITEITWDVEASRRYSYEIRVKSMASKKVIERGKGSGSGTGDFAVSNNKAFVAFSLKPNDYVLTIKDLDVGVEDFYNESETFSVKDCPPYFPPNLTVPGCVKSTQSSIEISWNVKSGREYSYEVQGGGRKFTGNKSGSMKSDDFKVEGDRGTLTITSLTEWTVGIYKVTVRDLTSSVPTVEKKEFEIRKGCKSPLSLDIDGKGMCLQRFSYLLISWKVEEDRTYKYSISKEGTTVKEATVHGSGSDGFPVDNGRGQLRFKLEPGDYTVTVQDLDAGVNDYYTESEDFTLKACNPFEIETSNCVEKGQKVTVSLLAFLDRTYEFSVLVENTGQAVLNGSFLSGVNITGVKAYNLDSSDSLRVGRYGVLIREVETGGEGYGNFEINSYGKIGPDVKYRANPLPDALYVCLHAREGRVFASSLTYKINDGTESSLHGHGMCLEEAYGGGQGTLEITIKKDGEMAGKVDIDYVG